MRLFVVGIKYPPETFLALKIRGLASAGIDVTVCSSQVDGQAAPLAPNMRLLRLPRWHGRTRLLALPFVVIDKLVKYAKPTLKAWQVARRQSYKSTLQVFLQLLPFIGEQPDVLHFEWNSAAVEYLPLFDFFTCPSVISCRGAQVQVAPANPSRQSFVDGMRLSFQKTSAIHCVSEAILEEIQVYGADPRKSKVIRPAVDPAEFEPPAQARTQAGPVQMVSTGSLIWRKGYEYALIAMKLLKLRGHDFCFQIIGDGPDYQRLFFTLRDLELEENVRLVGKLKPADVRTTLQQADIFVLSSLSEGISNAVLEAMASGLPVVTTDSGGMAEAVDDGVEGFLVPPRDPSAMADALEILIRDRDLRARMAAAARDRFLRQFTLQRQIDEYLDLYNSLCNGHQQAGR